MKKKSGPKNLSKTEDPLEIIFKLWSSDIIQHIINETKEYIPKKKITENEKRIFIPNPPKKKEKITFSKKIIMDFLFTIVSMGINPQPSIRDYFKKDGIFGSSFIKKIIKTEKKFFKINNQIHFDTNFIIKRLNILFKYYYDSEEIFVIVKLWFFLKDYVNLDNI